MAKEKVRIGSKPDDVRFNITAKVGTTSARPVDNDKGKPLKLAGKAQYAMCDDGDDIEATLTSLENFTADQIAVGTVKTGGYIEAIVTAGGWAIGDLVVAAVQAPAGELNDSAGFPRPKVKVGVPTMFNWRIVDCIGTVGAANGVVTLELV